MFYCNICPVSYEHLINGDGDVSSVSFFTAVFIFSSLITCHLLDILQQDICLPIADFTLMLFLSFVLVKAAV